MERVAVVGSPGAGKSTFSRLLAHHTGLPLIHLDEHFWKPGWVETGPEEWQAKVAELAGNDRWIIDGNYGGTVPIRLARADTAIVFGLPRSTCLASALRRSIMNRGQAVQAKGCPEQMTREFARYIWRFPNEGRQRLNANLSKHGHGLRVVEFRQRRDAASFLDDLVRNKR